MQLHREDFEIIKVIGRGAFGEVRDYCMTQALLAAYFLAPVCWHHLESSGWVNSEKQK